MHAGDKKCCFWTAFSVVGKRCPASKIGTCKVTYFLVPGAWVRHWLPFSTLFCQNSWQNSLPFVFTFQGGMQERDRDRTPDSISWGTLMNVCKSKWLLSTNMKDKYVSTNICDRQIDWCALEFQYNFNWPFDKIILRQMNPWLQKILWMIIAVLYFCLTWCTVLEGRSVRTWDFILFFVVVKRSSSLNFALPKSFRDLLVDESKIVSADTNSGKVCVTGAEDVQALKSLRWVSLTNRL